MPQPYQSGHANRAGAPSHINPSADRARPGFAIHNEDFPALSAVAPQPSTQHTMSSSSSSYLDTGLSRHGTASALGESIAGTASSDSATTSTTSPATTTTPATAAAAAAASASSAPGPGAPPAAAAESDKSGASRWGLTGLLSVIRMTDPDLNTLALGTDLTTLGLDLNSTEVLYATFAYPCMDTPCRREPDYVLPYCYYMQPPALKTSHLSKFHLETLFYIFYNMPKDTLQVYAAKELFNRDWRYHKEHKLWFTRDNSASAQQPGAKGGGRYIYFDINSWERRIFRDNNIPGVLTFMTEEEHGML